MIKFISCITFCMATAFLIGQACGGGGGAAALSGTSAGGFSNSNYSALSNLNSALNEMHNAEYLAAFNSYKNIIGSPYLLKESSLAAILTNDGTLIEDVPLRYDLYSTQIVATQKNGTEIMLDTRYYKEIQMDVDGQQVSLKKVNPKNPDQFYEVLYESGDVVFFKDQKVRLKVGENLGVVRDDSRFTKYTKYFVVGEDGAMAKVNLKKRNVLEHFPEVEAIAMREQLKKSKIKLSKEKDYKELFAAMDD